MDVNNFLDLPFVDKTEGLTPNKFFLIVLWKTHKSAKQKTNNGNLVASNPSSASTITPGGDASIKPKHLSFLTGGTGDLTKGNRKSSDQRVEMSQTRQPSIKTVN
ncbi:MAG: hypothetical protein WCO49_00920 [Nostocales cyanobacterium ELA608]